MDKIKEIRVFFHPDEDHAIIVFKTDKDEHKERTKLQLNLLDSFIGLCNSGQLYFDADTKSIVASWQYDD